MYYSEVLTDQQRNVLWAYEQYLSGFWEEGPSAQR